MLAYSLGAETVSPRAGNALTTLQTLPAERHPSSAEEATQPHVREPTATHFERIGQRALGIR
jgi:hypothetical protein